MTYLDFSTDWNRFQFPGWSWSNRSEGLHADRAGHPENPSEDDRNRRSALPLLKSQLQVSRPLLLILPADHSHFEKSQLQVSRPSLLILPADHFHFKNLNFKWVDLRYSSCPLITSTLKILNFKWVDLRYSSCPLITFTLKISTSSESTFATHPACWSLPL